jgi:hypothetical protein
MAATHYQVRRWADIRSVGISWLRLESAPCIAGMA